MEQDQAGLVDEFGLDFELIWTCFWMDLELMWMNLDLDHNKGLFFWGRSKGRQAEVFAQGHVHSLKS